MDALAAEVVFVLVDRVEDGSGGGLGVEANDEAELPVEVASAEGGVVAVGQSEAGVRKAPSEGFQHAGLVDAGLAGEEGVAALFAALDETVDDDLP